MKNNANNDWYEEYQQQQEELDNLEVGDPGYTEHDADFDIQRYGSR